MNEAEAASGFGTQADDVLTAGMLLRRAREAAGLHIAAVAVALKVPPRKLEALESDRLDLLPDAVFVRALASSVCRTLKIDPQPVLARLPRTSSPRLIQNQDGINTPFRAPSDGNRPSWFDQLPKPALAAVVALLVGALVVVFLPARDDVASARVEPAAAVPLIIPGPSQEPEKPLAALAASPVPAATPVGKPVPAAPEPASVSAAPPAIPVPAAPVAVTVASTTVPGVAGIVVFRARASSWVQVTDARGVIALRRLLASGESAGASGTLPLDVTIGSASATDVQVRGKAFDLVPVSRDNVARFEVK